MSRPNKHISDHARCPYYRKHYPLSIYCDGFPRMVSDAGNFPTKDERYHFMKNYCESEAWTSCPKASTLRKAENGGE